MIKLFPAREGLGIDTPAGDGKTANVFFTVYVLTGWRQKEDSLLKKHLLGSETETIKQGSYQAYTIREAA
jgi:hypothetical protein